MKEKEDNRKTENQNKKENVLNLFRKKGGISNEKIYKINYINQDIEKKLIHLNPSKFNWNYFSKKGYSVFGEWVQEKIIEFLNLNGNELVT